MPLWHTHIHTYMQKSMREHNAHLTQYPHVLSTKKKTFSTLCSLIMDVQFSLKKKKMKWKREGFMQIKSLLVLLLLELLQQSHLCWADCQVTVCDTGGKKKCRGGGLRVVRQTTHQQANSSLVFSSVFIASRANWSVLYCYWEQREKHRQVREDKERQMRGSEKEAKTKTARNGL